MGAEVARRHPADVGNVQTEQDAPERNLLRGLVDRCNRVRRRDLAESVELEELLLRQPVQIRERAHETLGPETADRLLADALDVCRSLDPVDQGLQAARLTGRVRAAVHRLARWLEHVRGD